MTENLEEKVSTSKLTSSSKNLIKSFLIPGYTFKVAYDEGQLHNRFMDCLQIEVGKLVGYGILGVAIYALATKLSQ